MRVRRCIGLTTTAVMLSLGFASAAHAADYPPTTSKQVIEGSSVPTPTSVVSPATASTSSNGLPFTGGNDGALVWVGIAAVGTGTFVAVRARRRTRAA